MEILDALKGIIGALVLLVPSALLIRNAALERRASKASSFASEIGSESQLLDAYKRVVERMAEQDDRAAAQDERMAIMHSQLSQATGLIDQLNRAAVRHDNDMEQAKKDAADYKQKWQETNAGLNECLISCRQQAAEIRILRAILTKNGLLTNEVETAIKAELDAPPTPPGEREAE